MDNKQAMMGCTLGSWLVAALAGALAAVLLMLLGGWGFFQAVFIGIVVFVVSGFLINFIMCRPLPPLGEVNEPAAQSVAPAVPVATATPAPAPVVAAPEPVTAAPLVVKSSKVLPGQDELATRKGEWKYEAETTAAPVAAKAKPAKKPAAKKAAPESVGAPDGPGTKPETLSAARDGGPDDLKQIKGVGPKLEALLHAQGFYHFDQLAAWGAQEVAWMDQNLQGFKGRVSRDDWVAQAKILAEGGTTEFSSKVKKGGVY